MTKIYRTIPFLSVFLLLCGFLNISDVYTESGDMDPPFFCCETAWADSVFTTLTPDERIAQLFMVAAYSNKDSSHIKKINRLIEEYDIGGLIFFQGGPIRQAKLTNHYQSLAKTPLLIAMDAEWGLAMRLDSTIKFPYQMTLGAIQDDTLIYDMGAEIARQCKRMGVHVNLAPVVDINSNPKNPVIGYRSFGEDKRNVARKGIAYMDGMQDNGVLANAKHFPGHGDSDIDSHKDLPVINHVWQRLDTIELYPFRELIKNGLGSIMTAHLYFPALEDAVNTPSTLSRNIVTGLLRDTLGFKGITFTDALNMGGVTKFYEPGEVDVKALLAGNDILLFSQDVPKAINSIKNAIENGEITQDEIDRRCKRILAAKQWTQVKDNQSVIIKDLNKDLNTIEAENLKRKLIESSLTLLSDRNGLVPLRELDTLNAASLSICSARDVRSDGYTVFQNFLGNYLPVDHHVIGKNLPDVEIAKLLKKLAKYDLVFVSIHGGNRNPSKNYGISAKAADIVAGLRLQSKVILTVFEIGRAHV